MASKHVFIPDKLSSEALDVLGAAGNIEVDYRPGLPVEEKLEAVKGAHGVIIRSATQADAAFLEAASELQMLIRAGVGVDNVDVDVATQRGVVVQNIPEGNTRSAAEHTIAMILSLSRNVPQAHATMQDGLWERSKFVGVEVKGKTLGVIGLGKIGRHVVDMAMGLGFKILAFDPFVSQRLAEEIGVGLIQDVGELASQSDFLTVHVPKVAATMGLINDAVLEKAKDGMRLINCARGGIVDEDAVLRALESGKIAGAALDVFETEPPERTELVTHPKVIVTPHLGASTKEAQENVAISASKLMVDFFDSGRLHSPVNTIIVDPDLRDSLEPYSELASALGQVQAQLLEGNPERIVIRFMGKVFDGKAQSFLSNAVLEGFLRGLSAQPINRVNARWVAKDRGLVVEEQSEGMSRYFVDMIKVEVSDSDGKREVGGTIRGRRGLRLVSLDDYHFDAVLEGNLCLAANQDRPGMIGSIGQAIAQNDLNISSMSLGRDKSGGMALSVLNIDGDVPPAALEAVRAVDGIHWAKTVSVGG
ncbi:MAG: phosphoglycerate dehydrogenase [Planctomycetota bacterium]